MKQLVKTLNPNISSSLAIFLFCKAPEGQPLTVADVREWLARVDELNLPDSTELEGEILLNIDFEDAKFSKLDCGECLPQKDCKHQDLLVELTHEHDTPIQR